jgi:hypothetical protein
LGEDFNSESHLNTVFNTAGQLLTPETCFTNFSEHGTIFTATINLKIDCGLLSEVADRYFGPLVRCPADYRNGASAIPLFYIFGLFSKIFQSKEIIK